jgi:hypothetical protein
MQTKMMSKIALAAVLAASLEASAVKTGPYVGVNVGYTNLDAKAKITDNQNLGATGNFSIKKKKGATQANIFVGYESMMNSNVILGTELSFGSSFSGIKHAFSADLAGTDDREYKIRQQWKTGLFGLVGTPLSDSVSLYGKLGLLYSRFQTKFYGIPAVIGTGAGAAGELISTKATNFFGIEPGIRLKIAMSEAMAAHIDASYAWYQSKKAPSVDDAAGNIHVTNKYSPRMWGVTAGISYKF